MKREKPGIIHMVWILAALFASLLLFSCATAPEEKPAEEPAEEKPAPEEEREAEEEVPAPDAARSEARSLQKYITDNDLSQYAEASFEKAEQSHEEAEEAYGTDNAASKKGFEEAIGLYREVLQKSVEALRDDYKSRVSSLRQEAEQLRTEKALPQEHEAAMNLLDQTENAYEEGNYRKAHELSLQALDQLELTVNRARKKRQNALEALKESQSSIEQTQKQIEEYEQQAVSEEQAAGETEQ